ncbi:MAG: Crp/Fnr family transcriptional regulator [Methanococcaceae archaeon]
MKGAHLPSSCDVCDKLCVNHLFQKDVATEFIKGVRQVNYKKGETILKQSSFANNVIFLKNGLAKLILESNTDKETIFKLLPSNSFACLSVLFSKDFVPFTMVALKNCSVCLIKKELLEEQLLKNNHATEFVLNSYSMENLFLFNRLSVLSTRNNHGKLADALLYTHSKELRDENATQYLTRNDWADLASISVESVNKILNELKNDLIIKINNDGIEISNIDLLLRLSRIG